MFNSRQARSGLEQTLSPQKCLEEQCGFKETMRYTSKNTQIAKRNSSNKK